MSFAIWSGTFGIIIGVLLAGRYCGASNVKEHAKSHLNGTYTHAALVMGGRDGLSSMPRLAQHELVNVPPSHLS